MDRNFPHPNVLHERLQGIVLLILLIMVIRHTTCCHLVIARDQKRANIRAKALRRKTFLIPTSFNGELLKFCTESIKSDAPARRTCSPQSTVKNHGPSGPRIQSSSTERVLVVVNGGCMYRADIIHWQHV